MFSVVVLVLNPSIIVAVADLRMPIVGFADCDQRTYERHLHSPARCSDVQYIQHTRQEIEMTRLEQRYSIQAG